MHAFLTSHSLFKSQFHLCNFCRFFSALALRCIENQKAKKEKRKNSIFAAAKNTSQQLAPIEEATLPKWQKQAINEQKITHLLDPNELCFSGISLEVCREIIKAQRYSRYSDILPGTAYESKKENFCLFRLITVWLRESA